MRYWVGGAAIAGMAVVLLAGCESDTSSKGFSNVSITGEEEQTVAGNRCAVRGHATNTGNRRARVRITYEGKNSGNVIATSVGRVRGRAVLELRLREQRRNSQGQPSSGAFVPPVSCAAIDDIDRRISTSRRAEPDPHRPAGRPAAPCGSDSHSATPSLAWPSTRASVGRVTAASPPPLDKARARGSPRSRHRTEPPQPVTEERV